MINNYTRIHIRGKWIMAPSARVGDRTVIITGKWIRMASIHDENWMEGEPVENPEWFITKIKELKLKADIFNFSRRLPDTKVRYPYHFEWDNVAAIPISTFDDWWQQRLSRKTRQEVHRSERLGVVAKVGPFNDDFIQDIVKLFNAIPTKQGMPFAHYGKDYASVKRDVSSFLNRSEFIGAYYKNELLGYLKIVYMGKIASILNIITNPVHFEKRPGNALIAEAVKICEQKGILFLLYGKYAYGNKTKSSLAEFKRRNGFEMIQLPRYYIPLCLKGRIIVKLGLHRGILGILPESLIMLLLKLRSRIYRYLIMPIKSPRILKESQRKEPKTRD